MDLLHSNMDHHVKDKHLSYENRVYIQTLLNEGFSMRTIARKLGCSPSTVSYEVRRGTVSLYNGRVYRYHAKAGQKSYNSHRLNSGRKCKYLAIKPFIDYTEKHFLENKWSLGAAHGRALATVSLVVIK